MIGFLEQLAAQTGLRVADNMPPTPRTPSPAEGFSSTVETVEVESPSDSRAAPAPPSHPAEEFDLSQSGIAAHAPRTESLDIPADDLASKSEVNLGSNSGDNFNSNSESNLNSNSNRESGNPLGELSRTEADVSPSGQREETAFESSATALQAVFNWVSAGENAEPAGLASLLTPGPQSGRTTSTSQASQTYSTQEPTEPGRTNRSPTPDVMKSPPSAVALKVGVRQQEVDATQLEANSERQHSDRAGDAIPSIRIGSIYVTLGGGAAPAAPTQDRRPSQTPQPPPPPPTSSTTYLRRHYIIPH